MRSSETSSPTLRSSRTTRISKCSGVRSGSSRTAPPASRSDSTATHRRPPDPVKTTTLRGVAPSERRPYIIRQSAKLRAPTPISKRGGVYAGRSTGFLAPHGQRRSGNGDRRAGRAGRDTGSGNGTGAGAADQGRQDDAEHLPVLLGRMRDPDPHGERQDRQYRRRPTQ